MVRYELEDILKAINSSLPYYKKVVKEDYRAVTKREIDEESYLKETLVPLFLKKLPGVLKIEKRKREEEGGRRGRRRRGGGGGRR